MASLPSSYTFLIWIRILLDYLTPNLDRVITPQFPGIYFGNEPKSSLKQIKKYPNGRKLIKNVRYWVLFYLNTVDYWSFWNHFGVRIKSFGAIVSSIRRCGGPQISSFFGPLAVILQRFYSFCISAPEEGVPTSLAETILMVSFDFCLFDNLKRQNGSYAFQRCRL